MEAKLIKSLIVLGVPGVALGIFYLLLRQFDFKFENIDGTWAAIIAILFLLIVGGIVFYALRMWAPQRTKSGEVAAASKKSYSTYPTLLRDRFASFIANLEPVESDVFRNKTIQARVNRALLPLVIEKGFRKVLHDWIASIDDEILLVALAMVKVRQKEVGGKLGVTQSWISGNSHPLGVGRSVPELINQLETAGLLAPSTEDIPKGTYHEQDAERNPSWDYGEMLHKIEHYIKAADSNNVFA